MFFLVKLTWNYILEEAKATLAMSLFFVSWKEKCSYRVVWLGQLSFDFRSYSEGSSGLHRCKLPGFFILTADQVLLFDRIAGSYQVDCYK